MPKLASCLQIADLSVAHRVFAPHAQRQQQMLTFSACMRAHGIKDFPDPSNGGIQLQGGPGSDLDPNNPTFQQAQQACQKDLPFKNAPGTAKAGGAGG